MTPPASLPLRDGGETIVDPELVEELGDGWYVHRSNSLGYVVRVRARRMERLHRLVIGAKPGEVVDHINGDTLDNRRANLRIVSHHQSRANQGNIGGRSRHRGVSWSNEKGRWRARLRVEGSSRSLGYFDDEAEAARAWNAAAREEWGDFARLNEV